MKQFKKLALKFLPILIALGYFLYTIIYTQPPQNWQTASVWQIFSIFIPILIVATFTTFLFTNYLPVSFLVGILMTLLFVVKINGALNWLIGSAIVLSFAVLIYLFNRYRPNVRIPKFKSLMKKRS